MILMRQGAATFIELERVVIVRGRVDEVRRRAPPQHGCSTRKVQLLPYVPTRLRPGVGVSIRSTVPYPGGIDITAVELCHGRPADVNVHFEPRRRLGAENQTVPHESG